MTDDQYPVDDPEARTMQPRCPNCDLEQYVLRVVAFSAGEAPCMGCGIYTTPMTQAQYRSVMQRRRGGQ